MLRQSDAKVPRIYLYTVRQAITNHPEEDTAMAKKVSCDCGKTFRESTDDTLVAVVQRHARDVHHMELSREQVLAMAEPA
jgi:hypothetical protein